MERGRANGAKEAERPASDRSTKASQPVGSTVRACPTGQNDQSGPYPEAARALLGPGLTGRPDRSP